MAGYFRRRLGRGEITGYLVFAAGFGMLAIRGGFQDPWVEGAVVIMALGALIAGRAGGSN